MNLLTKQKQTYKVENKLMVTKGERGGGGVNQEFAVNRYTLYKMIINKDLLYSTGNNIQYLVITYTEKNTLKEFPWWRIGLRIQCCHYSGLHTIPFHPWNASGTTKKKTWKRICIHTHTHTHTHTHIHVCECPCCIPETNTTLCINFTSI